MRCDVQPPTLSSIFNGGSVLNTPPLLLAPPSNSAHSESTNAATATSEVGADGANATLDDVGGRDVAGVCGAPLMMLCMENDSRWTED